MNYSIGSDPEVVLTKGGQPWSAIGLIGGTKDVPRKTKHGWVLEDNVLAEFNTKPSKSAKQFIKNHRLVLQDLEELVKPLDLDISIQATAHYPMEQLRSKKVQEFGCEPDWNAWTLEKNPRPDAAGETLRSCGGHVHVCMPDPDEYETKRADLVKVLDLLLGVPSVILDTNQERRQLYGKAGAHRPKYKDMGHPYDGVEYRVLSNFWLASDQLMAWVFNNAQLAILEFHYYLHIIHTYDNVAGRVVETINSGDVLSACSLVKEFNIPLPKL